jgi:hypothetical protein
MAIDSSVPVAAVRVPAAGLRHQVRAATVVWQREMIRFGRDRSRLVSSLIQPVLFLFVLGTGLSSLMSTGDLDFRTFLFPGVLAMSVVFDHLELTPAARATFDPGITWAGWQVPLVVQVAVWSSPA